MTKLIAILRGINVGGKRKILMADLRDLFRELAFTEVSTYIQSGNVLFSTKGAVNIPKLEDKIATAIKEKYDFEVPVILRKVATFNKIISNNPFAATAEIERLHCTFLKSIPDAEKVEKIKQIDCGPDSFTIEGSNVYVYCSGKYYASKLTNKFFESKLKVPASTRNWKTMRKLLELTTPEKG